MLPLDVCVKNLPRPFDKSMYIYSCLVLFEAEQNAWALPPSLPREVGVSDICPGVSTFVWENIKVELHFLPSYVWPLSSACGTGQDQIIALV